MQQLKRVLLAQKTYSSNIIRTKQNTETRTERKCLAAQCEDWDNILLSEKQAVFILVFENKLHNTYLQEKASGTELKIWHKQIRHTVLLAIQIRPSEITEWKEDMMAAVSSQSDLPFECSQLLKPWSNSIKPLELHKVN